MHIKLIFSRIDSVPNEAKMQESSKSFLIKDLLRDLIHTADTETGTQKYNVPDLLSVEFQEEFLLLHHFSYSDFQFPSINESFEIHSSTSRILLQISSISSISLCERVRYNFLAIKEFKNKCQVKRVVQEAPGHVLIMYVLSNRRLLST